MKKVLFLVCGLEKETEVSLSPYNYKQKLPCIWADGMIGVLPVFDNITDAETYADGKLSVVPISIEVN